VLKDLDFTLDLLLLDGLQDLDTALLIVDNVDTLKDLGIFASAHLANDLVNFLSPKGHIQPQIKQVGQRRSIVITALTAGIKMHAIKSWRLCAESKITTTTTTTTTTNTAFSSGPVGAFHACSRFSLRIIRPHGKQVEGN
jgi:hypothetical protein